MQLQQRPVRLLASVTNASEALTALDGGADIIDAKDPAMGALGALSFEQVGAIGRAVAGRAPVSATVGDLPCEPDPIAEAAVDFAATGIDIVKVGFFPGGAPHATIARLGELELGRARLVGVLFADQDPDFSLIPAMARAGFGGVMLDTARKETGALPEVMGALTLQTFVAFAREVGLLAGLAGALRLPHIPGLLAYEPDILGFRGALCRAADRGGPVELAAVQAIRSAIPQRSTIRTANAAEFEGTPA